MLKIVNAFRTGQATVGLTEQALPAPGIEVRNGLRIRAAATNTGLIYIGRPGVTTATGFELGAGQEIDLEVDGKVNMSVIASAITQKLSWLAR